MQCNLLYTLQVITDPWYVLHKVQRYSTDDITTSRARKTLLYSADGAEILIGLILFQFINLLCVLGNATRKSGFEAT